MSLVPLVPITSVNESHQCALYPLPQSVLSFTAKATQIRRKMKQMLDSLRFELGTFSTEGSALQQQQQQVLYFTFCVLHYIKYIF